MLPIIKEKNQIEHKLSETKENSATIKPSLERLHQLQSTIEESGYYSKKESAAIILSGLGFKQQDFQKTTDQFSGGWQMRIALAKILLSKPDIMLLDEPTNYLDLEARNWLEDYLNTFKGGYIIVSHDRFFLDSTVSEVASLFKAKIKIYKGNYTSFEEKKELEIKQLIKDYTKQQEEIAKTEDFINRFRYKASKAKQVQSRVKQLEKLKRIELPENMKQIQFHFPKPPHSGKQALKIENLNKSYGNNHVIKNLVLYLDAEEKLVITGKNGAGKSTLMRIIAGIDKNFSGSLHYGSGVKAGYFSQDIDNSLSPKNNVFQEIEAATPTKLLPEIRGMLGAFLFRGDDIYKSVKVLSGGERNRLSLLKLLLHPSNLLILDEPTNHLDLRSKDVLLKALKEYSGTLIFVSHDRYFIENLATKVLEMKEGNHTLYPGDYEYYLWRKMQEDQAIPVEQKTKTEKTPTDTKITHQESKRIKNRLNKIEQNEKELLSNIETLEQETEKLKQKLHEPENYSSIEKANNIQKKNIRKRRKATQSIRRMGRA